MNIEHYSYDNIGSCITAQENDINRSYDTNQYTQISQNGSNFIPTYDLDGNQTKIQSSTGEWLVRYNANNRPISFTQGNTRVERNYDYSPYGAILWSKENIPNPIQEGGYLHLYEFDRLWRGAAFICEALSCSRGISTIEQQNTAVAEGKPLDNHLPTIQRAFTEFSLRYHASYTHNFILNSIYS